MTGELPIKEVSCELLSMSSLWLRCRVRVRVKLSQFLSVFPPQNYPLRLWLGEKCKSLTLLLFSHRPQDHFPPDGLSLVTPAIYNLTKLPHDHFSLRLRHHRPCDDKSSDHLLNFSDNLFSGLTILDGLAS